VQLKGTLTNRSLFPCLVLFSNELEKRNTFAALQVSYAATLMQLDRLCHRLAPFIAISNHPLFVELLMCPPESIAFSHPLCQVLIIDSM